MRQAFVKALIDSARQNKKIYLITGDLGFRILEPFAEAFPDRFLNIGVAEANMITVAAGLATTGYIPFVYSIATFASMRPFEQIRNDVCLQNLNVKIVGIGGGLAYTKAGPTHHSMEDIGLMRLLPGMTIIAPKDPEETYLATVSLTKHTGPAYLRLEKNPSDPDLISSTQFIIGKAQRILEGEHIAILTCGVQAYSAVQTASLLQKRKINAGVYSFSTIHPIDIELLNSVFDKYNCIVTLEEHRTDGGFGTIIAEHIASHKKKPSLIRLGLKNIYTPLSADYQTLLTYHQLTPEQLTEEIIKIVSHK